MKILQKILPLFGIAGVVFYFFHVLLGTFFYPRYNSMSQAISDLTASRSPAKKIAMPFSLLYGLFSVIFSVYFFIHFRQTINQYVTFGAAFLCVMTIISFFGYAFFPLSKSGYAGTFQDKMHIAVTIMVVLCTIISLILFVIGFFKTSNLKYLGIISCCTFLLLFIGAILMKKLPKAFFGLAERINVFSTVIYIGIISLWMYTFTKG